MSDVIKNLDEIRKSLVDDISLRIFNARKMYSIYRDDIAFQKEISSLQKYRITNIPLLGNKIQELDRKWNPRMAVCVYHKPEDILEIPMLIKKMNPDYKFALRHYSSWINETVLYAWVE